jgi:hypothetical protein
VSRALVLCAGGCGRRIPGDLVSCGVCFQGLPRDLRRAMNRADPFTDATAYLDARRAARTWLSDQPQAPVGGQA